MGGDAMTDSVRMRRASSVEIDKNEIDKWTQMLVYGAGKTEVNGVYIKYRGPEAPEDLAQTPFVYVRQLEDIAENPDDDRFWLWRTNMEVKFQQQECWKISKLPPWELENQPHGDLKYLYYCLSDDLCPPSVGWKAFDSEDHCPVFKMLDDGNIEITGSVRHHLNKIYYKQDDDSWMSKPKKGKHKVWIYKASAVIGPKTETFWQVANYPLSKLEKKKDHYFYRCISDSDELPSRKMGWKEQEHRSVSRPPPLVEPRKWNVCHVQFAGRDDINGGYRRMEVTDYETKAFRGNYVKGDGLDDNSGHFARKFTSGHFYFQQEKEPHHLIYMVDQKSHKKNRTWVLASPDGMTRHYIATQEGKMADLVQYPPTFGWSCNPAHEPVEGSDSESAAQAVNVDEDDSEDSSSTESDSGERQDNFRHPDWPPPVVTNTLERFQPEYVISFRIENYGYHLKLVRDTIEMIANVDPETGEEMTDWYDVFEDNETGDPNYNKMPYKPVTILKYLKNAHLHYQLRLSKDRKHIFCFISADSVNMKRWAAYMDHDLKLDAENAINIGRHEVAMLLAKRTLKEGEDQSQVGGNFILTGVFEVVRWLREDLCFGVIGCCLDTISCFDPLGFFFNKAQVNENKWHNVYVQYSDVTREEVYTRYNTDTTDVTAADEPILKIDDAKYEDGSIFSPRHRLRIVYEMLTGECFDDPSLPSGAQLRVEEFALNYNHPLEAIFALHDKGIYEEVVENFNMWGVMSIYGDTYKQSIKEIRNYYGEEIGYYFAFMRQYTHKLKYPAFIGIFFFVMQLIEGEVAIQGITLYVAIVIIWSVIFMEWWERYETELSNSWGMSRFARKAVPRPQFHGQKVISSVNGKVVEDHRFKLMYYCGLCCSYSTVFFFVALVLVAVVHLFIWRDDMGDEVYYSMLIGAINAIMIQVFNILYSYVSFFLNEWENHRLQPEWDKSMVWKKILFYLVNSFSSLFYIAFIRDVDGHTNQDTLQELQIQLGSLFVSMIIIQNITERLLNPVMKFVMEHIPGMQLPEFEGLNDIDHSMVIQAKISEEDLADAEDQIQRFPSPELLDQMAELVVQYGYVTLFVMAFPLAPFLAVVNNFVEAHVDTSAWKEGQRPIPKGAVGIGEWNTVLELFSYIAVLTNIGLIAFRTDNVDDNFNVSEAKSDMAHVWFFAAGCAVIYLIVVITKFLNISAACSGENIDEHFARSLEIEKNLVAKALKPTLGDGTLNSYLFSRVDTKYWKVINDRGNIADPFTQYLLDQGYVGGDMVGGGAPDQHEKRSPQASLVMRSQENLMQAEDQKMDDDQEENIEEQVPDVDENENQNVEDVADEIEKHAEDANNSVEENSLNTEL